MSALRRIYLLTDASGHSAVAIAADPAAAQDMVWFGRSAEVHLLGVARDGVPAGRVGQLDHEPPPALAELIRANAELGLAHTDLLVAAGDQARRLAALRSLVERAKEAGIDDAWRKEARVVLRATEPAGQGPGVVDG